MSLSSNYTTSSKKSQDTHPSSASKTQATPLRLFNTKSRKLETFKPQDPKNVTIYTCGPTVYDYAHIGNLTSYIYWDLLIRTLRLDGYNVDRIMNFTDVGHLVSDEDEGEDKMEKGARREGKTVLEIAKHYEDAFVRDFTSLNLLPPRKFCPATDYIDADIKLVDLLTEKGYTYETTDGIYFDTSKFKKYPDFARLDLDHLKAGARVNFNSEKRNVSDFAVWKFIQPGEKHALRWDYLNRPGYPGWHLECSTIIHEEFGGKTLDIHTGGLDHIPVHHTNEIAQSESAYDMPLARFWLHCNFINIDGSKISKSLGNTYTLADLKNRGFTPFDFKMWVLQGHYQSSDRNFNFADLEAAKNRLAKWREKTVIAFQLGTPPIASKPSTSPTSPEHSSAASIPNSSLTTSDHQRQILNLANNNLASPEVMAYIDQNTGDLSYDDWLFIDAFFGLELGNFNQPTADQLALIERRFEAKKSGNYAVADELRTELESQGFSLKDLPDHTLWLPR